MLLAAAVAVLTMLAWPETLNRNVLAAESEEEEEAATSTVVTRVDAEVDFSSRPNFSELKLFRVLSFANFSWLMKS